MQPNLYTFKHWRSTNNTRSQSKIVYSRILYYYFVFRNLYYRFQKNNEKVVNKWFDWIEINKNKSERRISSDELNA